jgi:hypothetical protein
MEFSIVGRYLTDIRKLEVRQSSYPRRQERDNPHHLAGCRVGIELIHNPQVFHSWSCRTPERPVIRLSLRVFRPFGRRGARKPAAPQARLRRVPLLDLPPPLEIVASVLVVYRWLLIPAARETVRLFEDVRRLRG